LIGESRKSLKILDPLFNLSMILMAMSMSNGPGDDDIKTFVTFYKGLFMIPIYKEEPYYSAFIPALKSGVFC
jgi:hypothetical protein